MEFFAAIPPGFFIFIVSFVCLVNGTAAATSLSLWEHLLFLSTKIKENPPVIIFVLFAAYLLGSIIRSMPVQWAEAVASFGRSRFPFGPKLRGMLREIKDECAATNLRPESLPTVEKLSSSTFNYWKDFLCARAPEAFLYYQSFEARSRFYTGMFWAGAVGIIGGGVTVLRSYMANLSLIPGTQLCVVSLCLCLAFGTQLRRVREQEARVLLTLFTIVALHADSKVDQKEKVAG